MEIAENTFANKIWKVLGSARKTQIVVKTNDYIFSGFINHSENERVLDVLNKGSIGSKEVLPEDFLHLTEAEIISSDGLKRRRAPSCIIAKPNILFVAERNTSLNNPGITSASRPLYQPKTPVCVEVLIPGIAMLARVHVSDWQQPMNVVDTIQMFLPLTKVQLSTKLSTGELQFDFIAVNRNQIIFMAEIEP